MTPRILTPTARGFLHLDSHPDGCARLVEDLWAQVPTAAASGDGPVAVVVGSSAGYGLAATIAGLARYGIRGVGVCLEKAPKGKRTATAGWYRTAATARLAAKAGADFTFVNADAFADATKQQVCEVLADRYGPVEYLVYSVAAPRRTAPDGATYTSVIKPIGAAHTTKTLAFDDGDARLKDLDIAPATDEEIGETVKVMGGQDWAWWVDALTDRGLLADGFTTVALSYIGSDLTSAIYRAGTIGAAKLDLEATATALNAQLADDTSHGCAFTSVNGAAVTQSSTAIPGIGLYISVLRTVLGNRMQPPIQQLVQLWDQLTGTAPLDVDDQGRIRLDRWELAPDVQATVANHWAMAVPDNLAALADLDWFAAEVARLYGWSVPGVDYQQPTDVDQPWPTR